MKSFTPTRVPNNTMYYRGITKALLEAKIEQAKKEEKALTDFCGANLLLNCFYDIYSVQNRVNFTVEYMKLK